VTVVAAHLQPILDKISKYTMQCVLQQIIPTLVNVGIPKENYFLLRFILVELIFAQIIIALFMWKYTGELNYYSGKTETATFLNSFCSAGNKHRNELLQPYRIENKLEKSSPRKNSEYFNSIEKNNEIN
jgi:hypothetical protein